MSKKQTKPYDVPGKYPIYQSGQYPITGAYLTNAVTQPDKRYEKTNVGYPNDENVEIARNRVDANHK
ncbi:MAG: DUF3787 domain-containing protein [Clostridiales bacterium]|nr:DUF3787 domain-containing protein [Clostridiales bacterium]